MLTVVSIVAVGAYIIVLLVVVFATRPADVEPGPATMELPAEPPALANLLVNRWRLTRAAVPATLLDLDAKGALEIFQVAPDVELVQLRTAHHGELLAFERRVVDHVARLAVDGVVPAAALRSGSAAWAASWWRGFRRQVIADAQARGLSRDRWSRRTKRALASAAVVPAVLVSLTVDAVDDSGEGMLGAGFGAWIALVLLIALFTDQRDTPSGRECAARWLGVRDFLRRDASLRQAPASAVAIWDRYLACAAAIGMADAAVRSLAWGAADPRRAWSSYRGRWRLVRIRYPRGFPGGWGMHPVLASLLGLAQVAIGAALLWGVLALSTALRDENTVGRDTQVWVDRVEPALVVVFLALGVWGVLMILRAVPDCWSRREVEGQVLRLRQVGDDNATYWAAVDEGTGDRVRAWRVSSQDFARLRELSVVRATVSPRLGHVFDIAVVEDAAPPPVEDELATGSEVLVDLQIGGLLGRALLGGGGAPDPRTLITGEDVSSALGLPVHGREPRDGETTPAFGGRLNTCVYETEGAATGGSRVIVSTTSGRLARFVRRQMDHRGQPLTGLEADAWTHDDAVVVVAKGDRAVTIAVIGAAHNRASAARQLARTAAARL